MITYLYVKTHTITGLKYLGKTIQSDPHKYRGSGTYWLNHLRKHGATYTTEILKECEHPAMVNFWGQHYSDLWNIVESDEWANLKPETGEGGSGPKSDETRKKISEANKGRIGNTKGIKQTSEWIANRLASKKANGSTLVGTTQTSAHITKRIETKKANNNTRKGIPRTPEEISKMLATRRRNGTMNCYSRRNDKL